MSVAKLEIFASASYRSSGSVAPVAVRSSVWANIALSGLHNLFTMIAIKDMFTRVAIYTALNQRCQTHESVDDRKCLEFARQKKRLGRAEALPMKVQGSLSHWPKLAQA